MRVEFKQNCEIQGKKFGHEKHLKPGIHEVPGSFIFDWFFVALVLDGAANILEVNEEEIKGFEKVSKEMKEKLLAVMINSSIESEIEDDIFEEETEEVESEEVSKSVTDKKIVLKDKNKSKGKRR